MMEKFVDDKQYWDSFYRKHHKNIDENTLFAEYILKNWVDDRKTLLEWSGYIVYSN